MVALSRVRDATFSKHVSVQRRDIPIGRVSSGRGRLVLWWFATIPVQICWPQTFSEPDIADLPFGTDELVTVGPTNLCGGRTTCDVGSGKRQGGGIRPPLLTKVTGEVVDVHAAAGGTSTQVSATTAVGRGFGFPYRDS
ncbi:hypothetical protein CEXT_414491 [Caerostris extrusa]|uniref:Uncharacterized protein n=1 Tax=Caerostris extrusa TaxID=172846 RepID=A0AAV4U7J0_CAEEX|nr:hypothetical protein CEXT_414491 [Caerostris extrusa]